MKLFAIAIFLTGALFAEGAPLTKLVSRSPNSQFVIETEDDHRLEITKDGTRQVGFGAEGPDEVILRRAKDAKELLKITGGVEGPVEAHWNANSTHVILYWHGYGYNWARVLVRVTPGDAKEVSFGSIYQIIRHDKRPLIERDLDSVKSGKDQSPPFENRRWVVSPESWLANDRIRLSVTELSREPGAPHPFQIAVPHYTIDAKLTEDGFDAEALYADQDFKRAIWTKDAEQAAPSNGDKPSN